MDIGKEIEELKKRFDALGSTTNWGLIYDHLKDMCQSMSGYDEEGNPFPDEEWIPRFEKQYGTKEQFIHNKEHGIDESISTKPVNDRIGSTKERNIS